MAGGGQKGSSQQVTQVQLPPWVNQASQENYQFAKDVANRPYEANPFGGAAGVAPWTDLQNQAANMLPQVGQYQGNYGDASDAYRGLLSFNPSEIQAGAVHAGQLKDTDLSPYLNPYTENVINRTTDTMERSGQLAQNKIASDAARGGSFGGSRQGVQQGVQQAETTRAIGDYAGKARADAFNAATANATADLDRALKGDTTNLLNWTDVQKANVTAQLAAAGIKKDAAAGLVNAATAGQQSAIATLGQYMTVGSLQQAQQQRVLDAQKGQWQEERDYPMEQLQILLSALGMSPYGKTEISSKASEQSQPNDMFSKLLGTAGTIIPILAAASDKTMKTDVQDMGADPATGVRMKAFRYKGDPKSYPKVTGFMAQDLEKKAPQLVRKVGRKKAIDLSYLAA